ncbi:Queuine tRNA-ribosyltransferase accessory subunit 2 [Eumeta japonica]|uniref:Queuine tRNA-ribosyltransferase accessory subunit 2 n=1 Tax=Eumeta variegata TaxID=151549 RepID=A0A4C2A019_EUMVA|nr:Queuine tRNA-ribosyltransferase accessory subunit 2 [Eumeta japonica]
MRYLVTYYNGAYERLGVLSGFTKSPNTNIETPTAALFTKGGSVVHLTADVLTRVFPTPQLLWLPLSNCIQLETGARGQNKGVAHFSGLSEHIACVSVHDTNEETPIGHFEKDMIPPFGLKMGNK